MILLLLFIFCSLYSFSEDLALSTAEYFYSRKDYNNAITEYKRFLFFNSNDVKADYVYYKIGISYAYERDWDKALFYINEYISKSRSEDEKFERTMNLAEILIAKGEYSEAEFKLLYIMKLSDNADLNSKCSFLLGIVYIYTYQWNKVKKIFNYYFKSKTGYPEKNKVLILSLIDKAMKIKYKSFRAAGLLSMFFPGAGQMYAGDWANGINAFLLNASLFSWLGYTIIIKNYVDAAFIFMYVVSRYYSGNIYNAERIAIEYNNKKNREIASQLFELLQY